MASKPPRRPGGGPPPTLVVDHPELVPADGVDKITAFFQSLGDDATVTISVFAIDPKDRIKGRSFLFDLPSVSPELTGPKLMEQVLAKYGPGEYLAEGRDADGKLAFSPRFRVGPLKAAVEIPDPRPASSGTTASSAPPDALTAILQNQTRLLEVLVSQQQQPRPSMLDSLRELKELRELIAPPAPPPAEPFNLEKMIELVTGVFKLRDELGEGGGGEGGALGYFAKALAPALARIADRAVEQTPPALPPAPPPSAPAAADRAAGIDTGGDEVGASDVMMKAYASQLIDLAEARVTPQAAVIRIADTLRAFPDSMINRVLDWLDDDNVVANLTALDARAAKHAEWINQTVDALLDAATEEETPPPAATPANGTAAPAAPG